MAKAKPCRWEYSERADYDRMEIVATWTTEIGGYEGYVRRNLTTHVQGNGLYRYGYGGSDDGESDSLEHAKRLVARAIRDQIAADERAESQAAAVEAATVEVTASLVPETPPEIVADWLRDRGHDETVVAAVCHGTTG